MSQNGIGDTPFAYEAFLVNVPGSKEIVACGNNINEIVVPYATGTVLENLVHACYKVQKASGINQVEQAVKVILVPSNGYLCRTDVLELRMRNSAFVGSVIRFPAPSDGHFSLVAAAETGKCNFLTLLSSAPGALLAKQSLTSHPEAFAVLEEELRVRLSFNWVLPTKPKIRKVALIGGRPVFDIHKKSYGHQGTFEAALALGILERESMVSSLESAAQLDDPPVAMKVAYMQYPLIVKPCRDGASRGVRKVNNYAGMRQAVQQLEESGFSKYGILLETYIDGPEVDANFVLWEGEVLFCEISDELPCQADAMDATISDNFAETIMLLPSRLDPKETQLIQSSLHQSLLKLGFRSGVFHVEARVRNSSMRYIQTDGILDLADAAPSTAEKAKPDVFLIEVNARPPGLQCVFATTYTYGVDFYGLQFLRAPEDRERFMALSRAFSCHAQYWCASNDSYPPPKHHSTQ
ncbi:fumipyrrole biosynthesis protein C [Trichophyton mentagrophytes]|nr:fumipyrrole biosynthesis protein C [Trichophyton mentagrophytes]